MIRVGIYEPYPMGLGGGNLNTQLYLVKLVDRSRFIPVVISPEETPFLDRVGFAIADRILFFCGKNRDDKYQPLVQRYASKIGILKIGLDPAAIREAEPSDKRALSRDLGIDPERFNIVALGQVYRP